MNNLKTVNKLIAKAALKQADAEIQFAKKWASAYNLTVDETLELIRESRRKGNFRGITG